MRNACPQANRRRANRVNNDCIDPNDGSRAYFYHQDANYRVIMLTGEDGNVVELVAYTAYGAPTVYGGYSSAGGGEIGNAAPYR